MLEQVPPEDFGDYFAWGETETKVEYIPENSLTHGLRISELESPGYIDSEGNLTSSHDAATANWGSSWRMPTANEMGELFNYCEWTWTQINGVNGAKVTGPNGNSIFLPAAGRYGSSLYDAGYYGYYWSSTPHDINVYSTYDLEFGSDGHDVSVGSRYRGFPVRPITE